MENPNPSSSPDEAAGISPPTPTPTLKSSSHEQRRNIVTETEGERTERGIESESGITTSVAGTPESSTKSEESGVFVEREDVVDNDDDVDNDDGEQQQQQQREEEDDDDDDDDKDDVVEVSDNDYEIHKDEYNNHDQKIPSTMINDDNSIDNVNHPQPKSPTMPQQQPSKIPIKKCFIHNSTPIPNSDSALRLLRKFIQKTSKFFPTSMGGTKTQSFMSYLFGSSSYNDNQLNKNECCIVYKELMDILIHEEEENDDDDEEEEYDKGDDVKVENDNEVVIESILGHSGDTMSKARKAMASFCRLIETWCLETHRLRVIESGGTSGGGGGGGDVEYEMSEYLNNLEKSYFYQLRMDVKHDNDENGDDVPTYDSTIYSVASIVTSELMSITFTCAEALVAHGCLDGVMIGVGEEQNNGTSSTFDLSIMPSISEDLDVTFDHGGNEESFNLSTTNNETIFVNAVTVLADSIFLCYLDSEEVELAGLKFLLTTGCRTNQKSNGHDEAMLRGGRLLQTIRVCYRIYLSTQSEANKTTAKAALRQIVISAFKRLENTNDRPNPTTPKDEAVEFVKGNDDPFFPPPLNENYDTLKHGGDDRSAAAMSYGANFSTFEHKDAYLVLRSLCKLSMKASVGGAFQNVVVRNESMRSTEIAKNLPPKQEMMMDPALDSKILALDLLVEILQGTKTEILQNAGPQLIYAVRNYLCHSLLKNCTSDNNYVVSLSLRLFVPLIRHFRSHLKTEIEAFVTNVFFVILDSKNSTIEHKLRVVILFEEICSDPATLAEIFLNYDCDLSAVDLFQRIVNTLAKVAKIGLHGQGMHSGGGIFVAGAGVSRAEKSRQDHRELRLEAMKAVKQVLSSLHESFATLTMKNQEEVIDDTTAIEEKVEENHGTSELPVRQDSNPDIAAGIERQSLVQIYDSKKKRREEAAKATLKFNQKPTAGIKFASEVGLINGDDPADVAQFLLTNKDVLDKTQIGDYLGREPDYQNGYPLKVLHQYLNLLDFTGLMFDDAIKFYLSGFRLPGEAQKVSFTNDCS